MALRVEKARVIAIDNYRGFSNVYFTFNSKKLVGSSPYDMGHYKKVVKKYKWTTTTKPCDYFKDNPCYVVVNNFNKIVTVSNGNHLE